MPISEVPIYGWLVCLWFLYALRVRWLHVHKKNAWWWGDLVSSVIILGILIPVGQFFAGWVYLNAAAWVSKGPVRIEGIVFIGLILFKSFASSAIALFYIYD